MSNLAAQLFAGSAEKATTERGTPFEFGFDGVVEILKTESFQTKFRGAAFISEFKVISCNLPGVNPGAERTWFKGLDGLALGPGTAEIYSLMWSAEGLARRDVTPDEAKKVQKEIEEKLVGGDAKAYAGRRVRVIVKVRTGKGKSEGKQFPDPTFYPITE